MTRLRSWRSFGGRARLYAAILVAAWLLATVLALAACAGAPEAEPPALPAPVAPTVCAPRGDLLAALESQYGEQTAAIGLADDGTVFEIVAAAGGATWTLIVTGPDGVSCVAAAGAAWQPAARPAPAGQLL